MEDLDIKTRAFKTDHVYSIFFFNVVSQVETTKIRMT